MCIYWYQSSCFLWWATPALQISSKRSSQVILLVECDFKIRFFAVTLQLDIIESTLRGVLTVTLLTFNCISGDWKGFKSIFQCVFSVYNSAFFCNLILAAAFVGMLTWEQNNSNINQISYDNKPCIIRLSHFTFFN